MKKFCAVLTVLVIVGGLALFFGWAQLGVPPDAYGSIRSKTHGVYPRLIVPGEFSWIWYKLIPTNTETTVFRLNTVNRTFSTRGMLPSGKTYAAFAGIDDDFSWEISANFSFQVAQTELLSLIEARTVGSQEDVARYEHDLAGQVEAFILSRVDSIEALLTDGEYGDFERETAAEFPGITGFTIRVKSASMPDFALYRQVQGLYTEYLALQKERLSGELLEKAQNRVEAYHRLDELEQYGQLLTKYPVLLEYLKITGGAQ